MKNKRGYMRKPMMLAVITILFCQMSSCSGEKGDAELDTLDKRFSYAMGYEAVGVINNLETVTIDEKAFIKGIRDAFGNVLPQLTQQQGLDAKSLVFERERIHKNQKIMGDTVKNLSEQKEFLEKNKSLEEVKATASGLQYKILGKGDGPRPAPEDYVTINSRARLLDGTLVKRLSTVEFPAITPVKGSLPFWKEALALMPTGSQYRFFVPSALAYGETGNFMDGGCVGPNQLIIIDIELLEIKKPTGSLKKQMPTKAISESGRS